MRAARIALTVDGICNRRQRLGERHRPLRTSAPWSNSTCTVSSMKNGLPSVRSMIDGFSGATRRVAEQRRQHLGRALLPQRIEPHLRVVGLVPH